MPLLPAPDFSPATVGVSPNCEGPLRVPAGESAEVTLTAWSTAPFPPWQLSWFGSGVVATEGVLGTTGPVTVSNGDALTLNVQLQAGQSTGQLWLTSTLTDGGWSDTYTLEVDAP